MNTRLFWGAVVALAACLIFVGTLNYPFVQDDTTVIERNPSVQDLPGVRAAFQSEYWAMRKDDPGRDRLYRPLTIVTLALNHAWGANAPFGYRFLNIILHALASLLFLTMAWRLGLERNQAGAAAILFALHPIHTEAVNVVVARADLMAAIGVFAGITLLLGRALPTGERKESPSRQSKKKKAAVEPEVSIGQKTAIGTGAASALLFALLAKEAGAALFLFAIVWWLWCRVAKWKIRPLAVAAGVGLIAGLLAYLWLRFAALGLWVRPALPSQLDNPLAHAGLVGSIWGALGVLGRCLKLLAWPWPLSLDYSYAQILPRGMETSLFASGALAVLLAWGLLAWRWRRASASIGLGLVLFLVGYLPVANLLIPIGTVLAERTLYIPSAGFLLAIVPLVGRMLAGFDRRISGAALAAAALAFAGMTVTRNLDWADPLRLWEGAVQVSPRSARALQNYGQYLIRKDRFKEAIPILRRSVSIYPVYDPAWIDLGIAQMRSGSEKEAEVSLKEALQLRSDSPEAHLTLGMLYYGTGRLDEARQYLERAVALAPGLVQAHFVLGTLHLKTGDNKRAIEEFKAALVLESARGDVHNNLAIALYAEGDLEGARRHALEAAKLGVRLNLALAKALGLPLSP